MSGAEAVAAIQLIDACIGIAKTIIEIGSAVHDATGLPPKLRALLEKFPAISDLLNTARERCKSVAEAKAKNARPVLEQCKQDLAELSKIFEEACPPEGENAVKRVWRGARTVFFGRNSKVQRLMVAIQANLTLLEQHEIYTIGSKLDELRELTEELAQDEGSKYTTTTGHIFANEGGNPTNNVGGSGNSRQIFNPTNYYEGHPNSKSMERPDFTGHFSHSWLAPVQAFVPRTSLRQEIREQLCDDTVNALTRTLAVWGLGGFGKTQLLLDYVQQYRTSYVATFWIEAGQKESLERDFINLYHMLHGLQKGGGSETIDLEHAIIGVKRWLSQRKGPWLLVFDGADSIDNERAKGYIDIKHIIPNVPSLHVIITTRSTLAKEMTPLKGIHVGDLDQVQAIELFYKCSEIRRNSQNTTEVSLIVIELGYLALAITLAGTYVRQTPRLQTNIKRYLPEYRQHRPETLGRIPDSVVNQYNKSVLTAWETTYESIAKSDYPQAAVVASMLSFLSSDDIYLELVDAGIRVPTKAHTSDKFTLLDTRNLEGIFTILERFAIVQRNEGRESYKMHKLVHAWGFERLKHSKQQAVGTAVLRLISRSAKKCGNDPQDKLRLMPHIMANYEALSRLDHHSKGLGEQAIRDIDGLASFLYEIGRYAEMQVLLEFVLDQRKTYLGEKHYSTILTRGELAVALRLQGHFATAAQIQRDVQNKVTQIVGTDNHDTIEAMHNLAITLVEQGHYEEAAQMQREVLEKTKKMEGENHADTIGAKHNLATTMLKQGHYSEAGEMLREVWEKKKEMCGIDHPDTVRVLHNYASALGRGGDNESAASMQRDVLKARMRLYGEDHPGTIRAMHNLALTLANQGQFSESADMLKQVLLKRQQVQGEDHPSTIRAMHNLALTLLDKDLHAANLRKATRHSHVRDEDQNESIDATRELAGPCESQDDHTYAVQLLRTALDKSKRVLGKQDKDTIALEETLEATVKTKGYPEEVKSVINSESPIMENVFEEIPNLQWPQREQERVQGIPSYGTVLQGDRHYPKVVMKKKPWYNRLMRLRPRAATPFTRDLTA